MVWLVNFAFFNLACFRERLTDLQVSCDDKGNYEALQCRRTAIRLVCGCVSRNGTDIEGTETTVSSRSEAPDCGKLVFLFFVNARCVVVEVCTKSVQSTLKLN